MTTWFAAAADTAAKSSVGDPGATRTVYTIVVVLVIVGVAVGYFTFRFWQRTRPGAALVRRPRPRATQPRSRTAPTTGPGRTRQSTDGDRRQASPGPSAVQGRADQRAPDRSPRAPQQPRREPQRSGGANPPVNEAPFDEDPWWDTRAPRPKPQPSLRDPLL